MEINDVIYKEIDDAIEEINKSIDKLLNGLEPNKNLEQFLKEFKKDECKSLILEDQLVNFVKFVEDKELDRIKILYNELFKSVLNIRDCKKIISNKIENIKMEKPSMRKKWFSFSYQKKQEELKILEFKRDSLEKVVGKIITELPNFDIFKNSSIDTSELNKNIKNYKELHSLDSLIKENPLFLKSRKWDLDSPQSVIKLEIIKIQKDLKKLREDMELGLGKKADLFFSKFAFNQISGKLVSIASNIIYKPIDTIRDWKKLNADGLIVTLLTIGVINSFTPVGDKVKSVIAPLPNEVWNIVTAVDTKDKVYKVYDFFKGVITTKDIVSELNISDEYKKIEIKPIVIQQSYDFPKKKQDMDIDY